ncbi:MAG TPA: phospholipase D-like domain-containing protein [Polyangiaceae bacterium]|nr:phospholipase D-like domain-containing protein [Polyangiaceae bacterium]
MRPLRFAVLPRLRPPRRPRASLRRAAALAALAALAGLGAACGGAAAGATAAPPRAPGAPPVRGEGGAEIELVETAPIETSLDHADVREAAEVWPEMIDRATRSLELAQFYASEAGGAAAATSRLAPVLAAIERAIGRGVRVRFLADASFVDKYPDTLERLRRAGADVRTIDVAKHAGGVLHAKFFVVDGVESYVGSQNFDWRSLAHIQEIGVRVRSAAVTGPLRAIFEADWTLAGGAASAPAAPTKAAAPTTPAALAAPTTLATPAASAASAAPITPAAAPASRPAPTDVTPTGETVGLVASPRGWLPDETSWELPALEKLLAGAARSVDLQVLTYSVKNRNGSDFFDLDRALRGAAARGVRVRLLVSHWADKPGGEARRSLEALARAPNVEVRVLTVPPWSGGDIPFARVAHAKYLVVDGRRAWIGTSNWEGDYFLRCRNVGVIADGGALAPRLDAIFDDGWSGPYTRPLAVSPASGPPLRGPATGRPGPKPALAIELGERLTRLGAKAVLVKLADGGIVGVNLDRGDAALHRDARQQGGGEHHRRRADAHQQVALLEQLARAAHHALVERVAEPDDVGPPVRAARAPARVHRHGRVGARDALAIAAHVPQAAVQPDDVARARALVQAVDVLGDHGRAGPLAQHLGHDAVAGVRLAAGDDRAAHVVKIPHFFGVALEGLLAGVVFVVVLVPHSPAAAIRRHAALGRHAGAGEEDDALEVAEADRVAH